MSRGSPHCAPGCRSVASAVTVNRFCASGIESIAIAAERIAAGGARAVLAGGTESMSLIPMGGHKIAPNPTTRRRLSRCLPEHRPCRREPRARGRRSRARSRIEFALESHQKAVAAIDAGRFADETVRNDHRRTARTSRPTKGRGATPRSRRSPRSSRRFTRRAPSPPATRRRPATAPRRWS